MESRVSLQQSYWRSQVHLSLEIDRLMRRRWRTTMKKFLLATVGLVALGMAAPASAADLAARPYTKAPPMVAAIYDWSGFYVGANGGWGSSRNCWEFLLKVATMQPGASPVVKSVTAGKAPAGYSASKLRVTGQICVVPMPAWLSSDRPIAPRSTHSACSPARSATPGTTPCST